MGISTAAASITKWASALSEYALVIKDVAPKKAKYAEVKKVLDEAQSTLKIKTDEVEAVQKKVAELEEMTQKMRDEKESLENDMDRSTKRMARAEKLVVLLKDEGVRWAEVVEVIGDQIDKLVGDVFLSCACISYYGAFTGDFREKLVKQWEEGCMEREIPTTEGFSLVKTMGDPVVIRSWGIAALPSDQVSTENGILCTKAERHALCIDPQQQANKWLKNMEKDNDMLILKFGKDTFLREVTSAVRIGKPVMVEDVEENVDPALDPILLKQQFEVEGGLKQIRIGDATVDFDDNFNLFMTTKMPNPHYIPEICIKVTLINFTVTSAGLEEQLLADVVVAERPEVEKQRDEIVLTMAADSKTLKDLEAEVLRLLSGATTEEILDQDTLIDILEESKIKSAEINQRMEQSKIVEVEITETRN
jgi:dynein heavy chain